jgi:modulator of FtsH protease
MGGWDNFFLAQVGASAALAGLLFVGVSLNLTKILELPWLPGRALEALVLLLTVLVVSSLMLVPRQPPQLLGGEVLIVGLATWLMITRLHLQAGRVIDPSFRRPLAGRVASVQAACVPFVVGGIALTLQSEAGYYWLVAGVLGSIIVAVLNAWVLLVEINR